MYNIYFIYLHIYILHTLFYGFSMFYTCQIHIQHTNMQYKVTKETSLHKYHQKKTFFSMRKDGNIEIKEFKLEKLKSKIFTRCITHTRQISRIQQMPSAQNCGSTYCFSLKGTGLSGDTAEWRTEEGHVKDDLRNTLSCNEAGIRDLSKTLRSPT